MDSWTRGHLRTWALGHFMSEEKAGEAVILIEGFVREHPNIIELPRGASWPEVWSLVERGRED